MLPERWRPQAIFLYRHPVDMRKQIDGLVALVSSELGRHPADRSLYVFRNRGGDKIKLLIWHLNGYWLLYKRTERQRFSWPDWFDGDTLTHRRAARLLARRLQPQRHATTPTDTGCACDLNTTNDRTTRRRRRIILSPWKGFPHSSPTIPMS